MACTLDTTSNAAIERALQDRLDELMARFPEIDRAAVRAGAMRRLEAMRLDADVDPVRADALANCALQWAAFEVLTSRAPHLTGTLSCA